MMRAYREDEQPDWWHLHEPQPSHLLDPTQPLAEALKSHLGFKQ